METCRRFFFNGELKMENGELAGASRDILHFQFSMLHSPLKKRQPTHD
ncbi:MAG: hypothetical protein LBU42_05045 [Prevotellaceae bacterium]|nr:hypothetical protein [Prevotellaceae bacterium]